MYKSLLLAVCIALPLAAEAAEEKKPTPQQTRMAGCNKEAGERKLSGADRKAFMSACLSAKPASAGQQQALAACRKDAADRNRKGNERKAFLSKCRSTVV
jgi:hypothetical protein